MVTAITTVDDTVEVEAEIATAAWVEETKVKKELVIHMVGTPKDVHMAADTVDTQELCTFKCRL